MNQLPKASDQPYVILLISVFSFYYVVQLSVTKPPRCKKNIKQSFAKSAETDFFFILFRNVYKKTHTLERQLQDLTC